MAQALSSGTAMHGRQAGDEVDDGGEAATDEGGRDGLTRAAAMGDGNDSLAMCGGCAADTEAVARSRGRGLKRGGGR